jgi:hypothetical protein
MVPRSVQKRNAEFFLKLADLPAQRRLGDVEPLRCLGEMQFFRDGNEISQMP